MATYILRRRARYAALLDLDGHLKLPESILAEQILSNAGISPDHQLLIRSALAGDLTVEKVNQELITQHSKVLSRASVVEKAVFHLATTAIGEIVARDPATGAIWLRTPTR